MHITSFFLALLISIPNCIYINNYYLDKTEVTIASYYWYLNDIDKNAKQKALPNNLIFTDAYKIDFNLIDPNHELFNFPIIGLDIEQCLAYCQWRSKKVNQNNKGKSIRFELPTAKDYESKLVLQKTKQTKDKAPFAYTKNSKHKILGIYTNVAELLADGTIQKGDVPFVGFRCKAVYE